MPVWILPVDRTLVLALSRACRRTSPRSNVATTARPRVFLFDPIFRATMGMKRFVPRYLDPASRLGEILFGLIMVLTVTLTAGLTMAEGRAGVRQLLFAAIGCNFAWGIIDAVMYIMNCITVRSGKVRLIEAIQRARDTRATLDVIQNEIEPELQSLLDPEEREAFSRSILNHVAKARITRPGVTKDDLYGALACFLLVFVSCLPAAIPFFI